MTEKSISIDTAKLAKEKGLPQGNNSGSYYTEPKNYNTGDRGQYIAHERFLSITQSLLQKWLRETYNIIVQPTVYNRHPDLVGKGEEIRYYFAIFYPSEYGGVACNDRSRFGEMYKHYEDALEVGLQEALKLIK